MVSSKDESSTGSDNSSGDVPNTKPSTYTEGEKVLAYHGPRIYEAKVQKAELRKNEWRYFVHYLGWNKNWDEWVGTDRLMKNTEDNVLKQQALDKKQGMEKNTKSGRSAQAKPKSSADVKVDKEDTKNNVPKGKKRKADSGNEKGNLSAEKLVKIQIPSTLKKQLVDDWEFITQQNKLMGESSVIKLHEMHIVTGTPWAQEYNFELVKLPRSPTVDDILTKYLEYRSKKDGMMTDSVGEILNGIRCYFDKALPVILLYKKERQQYQNSISDDISPSSVYGAEHLLRLFVKLPELLAYVKIEEETLIRLQQKMLDFLKFMQKNQGTFFLSAYDGPKTSVGSGKDKES